METSAVIWAPVAGFPRPRERRRAVRHGFDEALTRSSNLKRLSMGGLANGVRGAWSRFPDREAARDDAWRRYRSNVVRRGRHHVYGSPASSLHAGLGDALWLPPYSYSPITRPMLLLNVSLVMCRHDRQYRTPTPLLFRDGGVMSRAARPQRPRKGTGTEPPRDGIRAVVRFTPRSGACLFHAGSLRAGLQIVRAASSFRRAT